MSKIEFFSIVDGLTDTYPVLNSKSIMPSWLKTAQQEYSQMEKYDFHIARFPGLVYVLTTGYIVRAWHDVAVRSGPSSLETFAPDIALEQLIEKPALQVQEYEPIEFEQRAFSLQLLSLLLSHSFTSWQSPFESFVKPFLQTQEKLPIRFTQFSFKSQSEIPATHSLTSAQILPS